MRYKRRFDFKSELLEIRVFKPRFFLYPPQLFAAALGLSAILVTSAVAFSTIKWIGAAFLIYFRLKLLYSVFKGKELVIPSTNNGVGEFRPVFLQGIG